MCPMTLVSSGGGSVTSSLPLDADCGCTAWCVSEFLRLREGKTKRDEGSRAPSREEWGRRSERRWCLVLRPLCNTLSSVGADAEVLAGTWPSEVVEGLACDDDSWSTVLLSWCRFPNRWGGESQLTRFVRLTVSTSLVGTAGGVPCCSWATALGLVEVARVESVELVAVASRSGGNVGGGGDGGTIGVRT
jgi:hypothetical protein